MTTCKFTSDSMARLVKKHSDKLERSQKYCPPKLQGMKNDSPFMNCKRYTIFTKYNNKKLK